MYNEFTVSNYSAGRVNFPKVSAAQRVTNGLKEHFLANYYGINPFGNTERYLMVLETSIQNHDPEASDAATLGMVDLKDNNKFIPLTKTYSWNFQQGCMLHWLSDKLIIYNDRRNGKFVSIILNISTREEKVIHKFCPASYYPTRLWVCWRGTRSSFRRGLPC